MKLTTPHRLAILLAIAALCVVVVMMATDRVQEIGEKVGELENDVVPATCPQCEPVIYQGGTP